MLTYNSKNQRQLYEYNQEFKYFTEMLSKKKMRLKENETNAQKTNSTVLNSTQLEEKQVCMAKAVKIFHTLSQED